MWYFLSWAIMVRYGTGAGYLVGIRYVFYTKYQEVQLGNNVARVER